MTIGSEPVAGDPQPVSTAAVEDSLDRKRSEGLEKILERIEKKLESLSKIEKNIKGLRRSQEVLTSRVDAVESADRVGRSVPRRYGRTIHDSGGFGLFGYGKGRDSVSR